MSDQAGPQRVVLIEDEPAFAELVRRFFASQGYEVHVADSGEAGLALVDQVSPHTVLLDLNLPGIDGFAVCREIRSRSSVPVIMLSAKSEELDKVLGLELGADDYVTKPFSPRELLARVRAVQRRSATVDTTPIEVEVGEYVVNGRTRRVLDAGRNEIELTAREFDLLWYLVRHRGAAVSREDLFKDVWGYDYLGKSRTVDAHVHNLRSKLPGLALTTLRGRGYRLEE